MPNIMLGMTPSIITEGVMLELVIVQQFYLFHVWNYSKIHCHISPIITDCSTDSDDIFRIICSLFLARI